MSFLVAQLLFAYTWSPQHIPLGKALTKRLSNAVCAAVNQKVEKRNVIASFTLPRTVTQGRLEITALV